MNADKKRQIFGQKCNMQILYCEIINFTIYNKMGCCYSNNNQNLVLLLSNHIISNSVNVLQQLDNNNTDVINSYIKYLDQLKLVLPALFMELEVKELVGSAIYKQRNVMYLEIFVKLRKSISLEIFQHINENKNKIVQDTNDEIKNEINTCYYKINCYFLSLIDSNITICDSIIITPTTYDKIPRNLIYQY